MKLSLMRLYLCFSLALAGCASSQSDAVPAFAQPGEEPVVETVLPAVEPSLAPASAEPVSPTHTPRTKAEMPEPLKPPLPPDPRGFDFETSDGARLTGIYYPAAVNPAPIVVLMHWAGGDKNDWIFLGLPAWLQNRGLAVLPTSQRFSFDTPYPFPPLPEERSFGVFVFDFRGFGESEPVTGGMSALAPLWLLDAQAAYAFARTLEGADPDKLVGLGASIGADAVVDACGKGCLGALSYGPGDYLGIPYAQAVEALEQQDKAVWCLGAEDDPPAVSACTSAQGEHYFSHIYTHGGHALDLFRQSLDLDPPVEQLTLNFLNTVFGTP